MWGYFCMKRPLLITGAAAFCFGVPARVHFQFGKFRYRIFRNTSRSYCGDLLLFGHKAEKKGTLSCGSPLSYRVLYRRKYLGGKEFGDAVRAKRIFGLRERMYGLHLQRTDAYFKRLLPLFRKNRKSRRTERRKYRILRL